MKKSRSSTTTNQNHSERSRRVSEAQMNRRWNRGTSARTVEAPFWAAKKQAEVPSTKTQNSRSSRTSSVKSSQKPEQPEIVGTMVSFWSSGPKNTTKKL